MVSTCLVPGVGRSSLPSLGRKAAHDVNTGPRRPKRNSRCWTGRSSSVCAIRARRKPLYRARHDVIDMSLSATSLGCFARSQGNKTSARCHPAALTSALLYLSTATRHHGQRTARPQGALPPRREPRHSRPSGGEGDPAPTTPRPCQPRSHAHSPARGLVATRRPDFQRIWRSRQWTGR